MTTAGTRSASLPGQATPPEAIRRALRRVDRRVRLRAASRGVGLALGVGALGAAAGMAADFAWPLPGAVRWAAWSAWVAAVGSIGAIGVIRPLLGRSGWLDLAAVAERADPTLGERLTGSIALLDGANRPQGSPALIAALAADAGRHAASFRPGRGIGGRPARARLVLGAIAAALVLAPGLIRPDPFGTLAARFAAPWLDRDRVGPLVIEVEPGDRVAAIGSGVPVLARIRSRLASTRLPAAAWLEWAGPDGVARRILMTPEADEPGRFGAGLPRLVGPVRYHVEASGGRSRSFRVEAVEPPAIASVEARVEPPAYTRLPVGPARDPARIEAVEGSRIGLRVATSTPVEVVELLWPGPAPGGPGRIELKPGAEVAVEATAGGPFVLTPRRDRHGLDGPAETRQVVVRPDAPPTVAARGPAEATESGADDILRVEVAARDDFAVAGAELHYEIRRGGSDAGPGPTSGRVDLALPGLGTPAARGPGTLALRTLDLRAGDSVSYRVRVVDNRPAPAGPNAAWSPARTLAIVAKAETMAGRGDRARRESFEARLEAIRQANAANRREVEQLRYAADSAQRDGSAWDRGRDADLGGREAEARGVVDRLQLLARDLEADPSYAPLAPAARQVAAVEAEAARGQVAKARQAADPARRLAELRASDSKLNTLGRRLDDLKRQFEALAKLDGDRQKLRDLAAREDALAEQADRGEGDAARLAAAQAEVRRNLDELLSRSPALRAGVLAAQADRAEAAARKARDLAARQRLEASRTADARLGAPGGDLARAQRDLEADARRLALDVDDPLAENGRGRLDVDAIRRAAEPIERGDLPEGVRRSEDAEDALRRLARDLADVPGDPRALARRLARRQEALANDAAAALAEARNAKGDLPADRKAELAARLGPLVARQEAIARLAGSIRPPEAQKGQALVAVATTEHALEILKASRARESEPAQEAAKRALNQLADALPDPNRVRDEGRRKLDEAKRREEEVLRDLERHLAEARPRLDKVDDDARAAADLAERIAPLARKQEEAAAALAGLDVDPRERPQRDRAAARAARVAGQIKAVAAQAPPKRAEARFQPPARWHLLGPFATAKGQFGAFDPARPVDLGAAFPVAGDKDRAWKPANYSGDEGKVDLRQAFGSEDNQTALAVAEVPSPGPRRATLAIGSDDSLVLWLNGRQVYAFDGSRGCTPGQDKVEVDLIAGVNRLALRCGNGNGEWGFAVAVSPGPPEGFDPALAAKLRDALARGRVEAQAGLARLEQKAQGKRPADDAAAELAAEAKLAAAEAARAASTPPGEDPTPRQEAASERRRMAVALRNLAAPDAPALQLEAVRAAEAAAALGPEADPRALAAALGEAAGAGEALARRLADELAPGEKAAALARAERALDAPAAAGARGGADAARLADRQRAIAAELDRPASPGSPPPAPAEARAIEAVDRAAALADRAAAAPNPADPGRAEAAAAARLEATRALEALAAAEADRPPAAPAPAAAEVAADPDLPIDAGQAARAADLARRQRLLRERIQAAMAERVAPQDAIHQDASALGREMGELRDRSREVNARSQGQAQAAADRLGEQAPRAMDRGAERLAQGKLGEARDAQRQAADLVEQAARDAEDMAAGLRAEGAELAQAAGTGAAPPPPAGPGSSAMAEAREAVRRSADQLGQDRAQGKGQGQAKAQGGDPKGRQAAAAASLRQAAASLRRAAEPAEGDVGVATDPPGPDNADPSGALAAAAEPDLAALQDLVRKKTGRAWGELPGHLRTEILQLSRGRYRDEYARLIQLYFREIAVDAASKGGKP